MSHKTIRRIFIFFLFFLPLQYGLIGVVSLYKSEPWPAFIFPGFKSVYEYDEGIYTISDLEFHFYEADSEKAVSISNRDLFDWIPRSLSRGFLRANFGNDEKINQFGEDTKRWLKESAERLYPELNFSSMDVVRIEKVHKENDFDTVTDSVIEISRITIHF